MLRTDLQQDLEILSQKDVATALAKYVLPFATSPSSMKAAGKLNIALEKGDKRTVVARNDPGNVTKNQWLQPIIPTAHGVAEQLRCQFGCGECDLEHRAQRAPFSILFVCQTRLAEFFQELSNLMQNSAPLFLETALLKQYSTRCQEITCWTDGAQCTSCVKSKFLVQVRWLHLCSAALEA